MMVKVENSDFSQFELMRVLSNQVNMPSTELECLMDTLAFGPYSDAHCEEGDEWKDND